MKPIKWVEDNAWWIWMPIVIICVVSIAIYIAWSDTLNDKEATVEGVITNVDLIGENEWGYDILLIVFDTGEEYEVVVKDDYDFTVNSKIIMKLSWNGDDDYWRIESMYKVPD